jgi:translocation and assembly module TamA
MTSRGAWLLLLSSIVGCARGTSDRPYVAELELRGVHNVSKHALEHGLASKPEPWWRSKQAYDELELARDRLRVQRFYEQHGYYATKVTLAEARPRAAGGLDVVIVVEEGPPTLIGDVKVMGLGDVDGATRAKVHKAQLGLRRGQVFHHADYERFKDDVLRILRRHGYEDAKVAGVVDVIPSDNQANVTVTATPSGEGP